MTDMLALLEQAVALRLLRPLDLQFARLLADASQPARLLAAACISAEAGEGHVCLPLEHLHVDRLFAGRHPELASALWHAAGTPACWKTALAEWPAIGSGEQATPLVLSHDRLYLHRLWQSEGAVARFFTRQTALKEMDADAAQRVLAALFGEEPDNWQKIAAAVALTRQTSVISGGPGTGKTTTVAKLLAAMIRLSAAPLRIQLTAPTGKAAARLTESLGKALLALEVSDEERAQFPSEATTLHRLLGAQPDSQRMRYHAANRLHLDVLVVDEASMVDLSLMARLIAALPESARVIFLGDRDQLASVEAGAVLGDICRCAESGYSPSRAAQLAALTRCELDGRSDEIAPEVRDSICLLRKSYRFSASSGIGQLARAVNKGDARQAAAVLQTAADEVSFQAVQSAETYQAMLDDVAASYQPYLDAVHAAAPASEILQAFGRYQLLCALRDGPFGVQGLNQRIEQRLQQRHQIKRPESGSRWYPGRPVMVTRNDSALGLFNGDIGITLRDADNQLRVCFPLPDGSIKSVHPGRLPPHDTAWAMTVHKSQGSEFDHTALVMPVQFSPVLTRELVYTAITRARQRLTIYSEPAIFHRAVQLQTQRRSGLADRLSLKAWHSTSW